jgi:hypothetical protein
MYKVIHSGTVQYRFRDVRDSPKSFAAVDKLQYHVKKTYLINLKRKDRVHHGTSEGAKGLFETSFS